MLVDRSRLGGRGSVGARAGAIVSRVRLGGDGGRKRAFISGRGRAGRFRLLKDGVKYAGLGGVRRGGRGSNR